MIFVKKESFPKGNSSRKKQNYWQRCNIADSTSRHVDAKVRRLWTPSTFKAAYLGMRCFCYNESVILSPAYDRPHSKFLYHCPCRSWQIDACRPPAATDRHDLRARDV